MLNTVIHIWSVWFGGRRLAFYRHDIRSQSLRRRRRRRSRLHIRVVLRFFNRSIQRTQSVSSSAPVTRRPEFLRLVQPQLDRWPACSLSQLGRWVGDAPRASPLRFKMALARAGRGCPIALAGPEGPRRVHAAECREGNAFPPPMAPSLFGSRHLWVTRAGSGDLSRSAPIMGRRRRTRVLSAECDLRVCGRCWTPWLFTLAETHRKGSSRGLIHGPALVCVIKDVLNVLAAVGVTYSPCCREVCIENKTGNAAGHRPWTEKCCFFEERKEQQPQTPHKIEPTFEGFKRQYPKSLFLFYQHHLQTGINFI